MRRFASPRSLLAVAAAALAAAVLFFVWPFGGQGHKSPQQLRLSILKAAGGGEEAEVEGESKDGDAASTPGRRAVTVFPKGTKAASATRQTAAPPTFGQPTIAGVGGWGFEADLRLDPTTPNRES
jgi:hypothetical protein